MSEIKVVPCLICKTEAYTIEGWRFHACRPTEALALEMGKLVEDVATQPFTRPPAPTECICTERKPLGESSELLVTDAACPKHGLKTFLAEALAENSEPVEQAAPPRPRTCGQVAGALHPRLGLFYGCVLTEGHEGEHKPGGNCFAHGKYVGTSCPQWPKCAEEMAANPEREPQRSEVKPNEAQSQKSAAIEQARPQPCLAELIGIPGAHLSCYLDRGHSGSHRMKISDSETGEMKDHEWNSSEPLLDRIAKVRVAAAEPAPERTPPQDCDYHAPLVKKAQEFFALNLQHHPERACSRFHNMAAFALWFANLDHDHQQRIIHPEHPEWRESKVPSAALVAYRADIDKHTAAKDFDSLWTTAESLLAALELTRAVAVPEPAQKFYCHCCGKLATCAECEKKHAEPAAQQDLDGLTFRIQQIFSDVTIPDFQKATHIRVALAESSRQAEPAPTPSRAELNVKKLANDIMARILIDASLCDSTGTVMWHTKHSIGVFGEIINRHLAEASSLGTKEE